MNFCGIVYRKLGCIELIMRKYCYSALAFASKSITRVQKITTILISTFESLKRFFKLSIFTKEAALSNYACIELLHS